MAVNKQTIINAIAEYCRAENDKDKQAWLALFAENIVHEDPVGMVSSAGKEKVAAFWDQMVVPNNVELWLTDEVIVCGNEAIALMQCRVGPADKRQESGRIVDNFVFDDAGKITRVRAFYTYQ
jgi:ketosteroid isomerase-like protein